MNQREENLIILLVLSTQPGYAVEITEMYFLFFIYTLPKNKILVLFLKTVSIIYPVFIVK